MSRGYAPRKRMLEHPYWQRQSWEGEEQFNAFQMYRDVPVDKKRTNQDIADKLGITIDRVRNWSKNYFWPRRVLAFDRYLDSKRIRQIERRRAEMHERHSMLSVAMQQLVAERLKSIDANELTARDLKEWMEVTTRIELRSRGEHMEEIKHTVVDGREEIVKKAKEFFNKMKLESPTMSDKEKALIVKEAFDVDPHELGLEPDLLTIQDLGSVAS